MGNDNPFDESPNTDLSGIIRRLAEIADELDSRGIDPLVKEQADLKAQLKEIMVSEGKDNVFDETSGWEAVLVPRTEEQWNLEKLKPLLKPAQRKRYLEEVINRVAVKDGIKNGDLSRPFLEKKGAVKKIPRSVALYVREKAEEEDDDPDAI